MKAELVPENGDPPIPITRDLTVVGRRDYCDITIDHHSLSKRHCVFVKTDGLLVVRDLVTTNGTKVKGQKVRWAALLPDDRVALGGYKVRIYLGPDDMPSPSEIPVSSRSRKTVREAVPRSLRAVAKPSAVTPSAGFPPPTPMVVPAVGGDDGLEIIEEDTDDSGWRKLMTSGREDDIVIELD